MANPLFLGFDCSTQSFKATVVDGNFNQVGEWTVNFDEELPQFKTLGGVHRGEDGLTVTTPTLLWVSAFDLLLEKMKAKNFEFNQVGCISGSGQQHGR